MSCFLLSTSLIEGRLNPGTCVQVSPTDYAVVLSTLGEVEQTVMAPQTDVAKVCVLAALSSLRCLSGVSLCSLQVWLPAAYSLAPGKRFMISAVIHTSVRRHLGSCACTEAVQRLELCLLQDESYCCEECVEACTVGGRLSSLSAATEHNALSLVHCRRALHLLCPRVLKRCASCSAALGLSCAEVAWHWWGNDLPHCTHFAGAGTSEERGQFPLLLVRVGQHLFGGSTSP